MESHLVSSRQAAFHYFPCWNVYCPTAHMCCSYSLLGSFSCFPIVLGELVETWSWEIKFRHRKDWHEPAFLICTSFHVFLLLAYSPACVIGAGSPQHCLASGTVAWPKCWSCKTVGIATHSLLWTKVINHLTVLALKDTGVNARMNSQTLSVTPCPIWISVWVVFSSKSYPWNLSAAKTLQDYGTHRIMSHLCPYL